MKKRIFNKILKRLEIGSYSFATKRRLNRYLDRKLSKMYTKAHRDMQEGDVELRDRINWSFAQLDKI